MQSTSGHLNSQKHHASQICIPGVEEMLLIHFLEDQMILWGLFFYLVSPLSHFDVADSPL